MYRARSGDTFESVARIVYGYASKSTTLRAANPGVLEPFSEGQEIQTPKAPSIRGQLNPEGLVVVIDGTTFSRFTAFEIMLSMDSIDQLTLVAPFDPQDAAQQELFKPFQYRDVVVQLDGDTLFTGTLVDPVPRTTKDGTTVALSCYATPGVLADCSLVPREFKNRDVGYMVRKLVESFNLATEVTSDVGAKFLEAPYSGGPVWGFITDLTKQRGLLATNDERGALRIYKAPSSGPSVATFTEGLPPLEAITPSRNPRQYFSEVTGRIPASKRTRGGVRTAKSGLSRPRPTYREYRDGRIKELQATVDAEIGRMKANSEFFTVTVTTWLDGAGELLREGSFVTLQAPGAFVTEPRLLQVRGVKLKQDSDSKRAVLELIIPGAL